MEHRGRFLVVWRRDVDAEWRIDRYLDVTPSQGQPADGSVVFVGVEDLLEAVPDGSKLRGGQV